MEILDGTDRSELIEITRPNSIENRVVKLLRYLHEQHPDRGWLEYLNGNSIRWQSVIVAGHSQGGGQAAIIAKNYSVARVIVLATTADYSRVFKAPAPWLSKPGATSSERYYGFVHLKDRGASRIRQAWELLGMATYGTLINVDIQNPPYNSSHQLTTAITLRCSRKVSRKCCY